MKVEACRVCLATDTHLHSFSENNVKTAFEDVVGSPIDLNNGLPKHICGPCKVRILQYAEFRKWCQYVQGLLNTKLAEKKQIAIKVMKEIHNTFPTKNFVITQTNSLIPDPSFETLIPIKSIEEENSDHGEYIEEYLDEETDLIKEETKFIEIEPTVFKLNDKNEESNITKLSNEVLVQELVKTEETSAITKADIVNEDIKIEAVPKIANNDIKIETSGQKKIFTVVANKEPLKIDEIIAAEIKPCIDNKLVVDMTTRSDKTPLKYIHHSTTITKISKPNVLKSGQKILCKSDKILHKSDKKLHKNYKISHKNEKILYEQIEKQYENQVGEKLRIKVTKWQCASCKYVFLNEEALQRHLQICSQNGSPCGLCGVNFDGLVKLYEHMAAEHNTKSDNTLVCFECDLEFMKEATLYRHWIYVHRNKTKQKRPKIKSPKRPKIKSPNKPPEGFVCDQCGKQFKAPSLLRNHMSRHTGEKPYQCNQCPKTFRVEMSLRSHKLLHSGEKPYICSVCSTAFRQSSHLHRHMRTHTGEKPYLCSVCPKAFNQSWNRDEHMRTVHEGLPPKPRPSKMRKLQTISITKL